MHFSVLAWRIPWTEVPGGLQSMGLQSWTGLKWLSMHMTPKGGAFFSLHPVYSLHHTSPWNVFPCPVGSPLWCRDYRAAQWAGWGQRRGPRLRRVRASSFQTEAQNWSSWGGCFLAPRRRLIRVWCCKRTSLFWYLSAEPCSANGCDFYGSVYGAEYSDWFSFPFPRALLGRNRQTPPTKSGKPLPANPTPLSRQWACLPTPCSPLHRSPATSGPIPRASDASQSLSVYSPEI